MRFNKKKIAVISLAICLIAILSMGTLAWFSAQDTVVNEFYIADSDDDTADKIFSVDVYEYTENSPTEKVSATETYKEVLPGATLKKEPHVANTGHYDQYVRVIVTISDASVWQGMLGENFGDAALLACFDGFDMTMWSEINTQVVAADNTIRVVMYYDGILEGGDNASDITVFKNVVIPEAMEQDDAAAFGADGFTITVKAQAVQTENVGANAVEAFATVGMAL